MSYKFCIFPVVYKFSMYSSVFSISLCSLSFVPRLLVGGGKKGWYPLLVHALNYGMLISVAFYGHGEMMSKYVATATCTRKMCVI